MTDMYIQLAGPPTQEELLYAKISGKTFLVQCPDDLIRYGLVDNTRPLTIVFSNDGPNVITIGPIPIIDDIGVNIGTIESRMITDTNGSIQFKINYELVHNYYFNKDLIIKLGIPIARVSYD